MSDSESPRFCRVAENLVVLKPYRLTNRISVAWSVSVERCWLMFFNLRDFEFSLPRMSKYLSVDVVEMK